MEQSANARTRRKSPVINAFGAPNLTEGETFPRRTGERSRAGAGQSEAAGRLAGDGAGLFRRYAGQRRPQHPAGHRKPFRQPNPSRLATALLR